jgi:hypothetical protein
MRRAIVLAKNVPLLATRVSEPWRRLWHRGLGMQAKLEEYRESNRLHRHALSHLQDEIAVLAMDTGLPAEILCIDDADAFQAALATYREHHNSR